MQKYFRDIYKMVEQEGLTVVSFEKGKRHSKLILRRKDGKTKIFIMSSSPSDSRTSKNKRADFKRFANGIDNA